MTRVLLVPWFLMVAVSRRSVYVDMQMVSALEALEHEQQPGFSLGGLSKLVEGASKVGADELERGVNALVDTLEFAKSPSVQASGKAMMAISSVVASIPMPPVTQIVGGILGAAGAVMSIFGPKREEPSSSASTDLKSRRHVFGLLETIDMEVRGLVRGVQQVTRKIDEILQLQRATYKYDVLGGKLLDEIESRYVQLFTTVKNAILDPTLIDSAVFQAKSAMASVSYSSYAKGALTPTNLKRYLEFVKKTKGGDVAVGHAFQCFIVARLELFWVVWTATIYIDGKVSLNSEDHISRLQRHMAEYRVVIKSVLGKDGLSNLLMTNTEIVQFMEQVVTGETARQKIETKTTPPGERRQYQRRHRHRHQQRRRKLQAATTSLTAATKRHASLFSCPSECQDCSFGRNLMGNIGIRFTCNLKNNDHMPENRTCSAPKKKKTQIAQSYSDFIATPPTPAPTKSKQTLAVKCDFRVDEQGSSAYKLLRASMRPK